MERTWMIKKLDMIGKSQADLARETDIERTALNKIIKGTREVSWHEGIKLAKGLELSEADFDACMTSGSLIEGGDEYISPFVTAERPIEGEFNQSVGRFLRNNSQEEDPIFVHCKLRARDIVDHDKNVSSEKKERTIQSIANLLFNRVSSLFGKSSFGFIISTIDDLAEEYKNISERDL